MLTPARTKNIELACFGALVESASWPKTFIAITPRVRMGILVWSSVPAFSSKAAVEQAAKNSRWEKGMGSL